MSERQTMTRRGLLKKLAGWAGAVAVAGTAAALAPEPARAAGTSEFVSWRNWVMRLEVKLKQDFRTVLIWPRWYGNDLKCDIGIYLTPGVLDYICYVRGWNYTIVKVSSR
jgi:hypothetical protein